jgi:hypothetical protein
MIKDWPNMATDDPDQIEAWFSRFSNANIGIATGQRSDIYVVDIDKKNGGIEEWDRLLHIHGEVPTATSLTGGGGFHLVFRAPDFELGNSAGKIAPGIDTRGDGGYIVVPPSIHESGETYKWVQWTRLRHLPSWIVEAIQNPSPAKTSSTGKPDLERIEEGVRNDTMTRLAGALRRVGADEVMIEAALEGVNEVCVDPPLPHREIKQIAESISRYEPGAPSWGLPAEEKSWVEYTGLDLARLPEPEVTWVVPQVAAKGIVTLLAGEWKTAGKTTFLISAMHQVLNGGTFLECPVRQAPVFYLYEGPADEFNQNSFAHHLHHENFHLVPQDENLGRRWEEAIRFATERCIELGAELLVIDTKTAWLDQRLDEENNAGFARNAMNMLAEAKLAGIACVIAAHPTKNARGALASMVAGSGQWAAAAGRQVGLWAYEEPSDPRREIEAQGRQGWMNNMSRTVIEWDRRTNTYELLGPVDDVREEDGQQLSNADLDRLLADFPDGSTKLEAEDHGRSLGLGRNQARRLVTLALRQKRLLPDEGKKPKSGPTPTVYRRPDPS